MNDSMYRYMKVGLVLPTAYPDAQSYPEALSEAVLAAAKRTLNEAWAML